MRKKKKNQFRGRIKEIPEKKIWQGRNSSIFAFYEILIKRNVPIFRDHIFSRYPKSSGK